MLVQSMAAIPDQKERDEFGIALLDLIGCAAPTPDILEMDRKHAGKCVDIFSLPPSPELKQVAAGVEEAERRKRMRRRSR